MGEGMLACSKWENWGPEYCFIFFRKILNLQDRSIFEIGIPVLELKSYNPIR